MENSKNWYVVYTKPRSERKVAELLEKKKIVTYYPRYNQVQNWQEKRKVINVALFTSFIFVYASENEHAIIKEVDGVSGILYWLQKPAVINDEEIVSIKYFLEQYNYNNIKLEKIQVNTSKEVNAGFLYSQKRPAGIVGINNVNKISLPSLGYALVSEAIAEDIKIVA